MENVFRRIQKQVIVKLLNDQNGIIQNPPKPQVVHGQKFKQRIHL